MQIRDAQRADPNLRSATAQAAILNVKLADLQQSLMRAWRLPELLIRISDGGHARTPNELCVTLAVRLARHTAVDWSNAAIPDDINDLAHLLNLSQAATLDLVHQI